MVYQSKHEPDQNIRSGSATNREAMYHAYMDCYSVVRGGSVTARWMSQGDAFWTIDGASENAQAYRVDPAASTRTPLLNTDRLRAAIAAVLGHEPPFRGIPFSDFRLADGESAIQFAIEGHEFLCDLANYTLTPIPAADPVEAERLLPRTYERRDPILGARYPSPEVTSPDGRWCASVRDGNLWLRSPADGRQVQLTSDAIPDYCWDLEGRKWAPWSPDCRRLAAVKLDNRPVQVVPLVHWLAPLEKVQWMFHVLAGGPLNRMELCLVDAASGRATPVEHGGRADHHVCIAQWLPDGSELLFAVADRQFKTIELYAANAETGASRLLLSETSNTFVAVQHTWLSDGLSWFTYLPKSRRFLWISSRDGWSHLYLYDLDGKLLRQLTRGRFPVLQVAAVDEERGWVYFTAHAESRLYDTHLYRVGLDGAAMERVTEGEGHHGSSAAFSASWRFDCQFQFSPSKRYFLDTHSSVNRPPRTELRSTDGPLVQVLSTATVDTSRVGDWQAPEEFTATAADGKTELRGVLYRPSDMDERRKYPVIEWIYGGPQSTWAQRTFLPVPDPMYIFPHALAQLGFVVVALDARGTPERSKAFHDVVYGNFGRHEIPDHAGALRQLADSRPYMDMARVGIFGHSWGGYFTIRALLTAPDVYHVGVAASTATDPYSGVIYEPYLGAPDQNREGYEHASLFHLADRLRGRLLFVQGTADSATNQDLVKMLDALVRARKTYDLVLLPEQGHVFEGESLTYYLDVTRRYFQRHLQGADYPV